mmetsp:Transcript_26028/g.35882  ORF Transcript_26028/g.35882 Transcript_26028/m.35882 type:complete len:467 (+) Transcript_26028:224-1624(+)
MRYQSNKLADACKKGDISEVRHLLEGGESADVADEYGSTLLHEAARNGHTETVALLLTHKANNEAVDEDGSTPLNWAIMNGHAETATLLLTHEANVEAADENGKTPLDWAVKFDLTEMDQTHKTTVEAVDKVMSLRQTQKADEEKAHLNFRNDSNKRNEEPNLKNNLVYFQSTLGRGAVLRNFNVVEKLNETEIGSIPNISEQSEKISIEPNHFNSLGSVPQNDNLESSLRTKLPSSIYGYTINNLLTCESTKHLILTPFGAILVSLVQLVMIGHLWSSPSDLCVTFTMIPLKVAAIWTFLLHLIPSLNDMVIETLVISHFSGLRYLDDNGTIKEHQLKIPLHRVRRISAFLFVLVELVVFCGVFFIGTVYILSSSSASDIVQACLSIVFINELDNIAFNHTLLDATKKLFDAQLFDVPFLLSDDFHIFASEQVGFQKFLRDWFDLTCASLLAIGAVICVMIFSRN